MKIGIAGAGHLGAALFYGLTRSGVPSADIMLCVRPEKVQQSRERFGAEASGDINDVLRFAEVTFIVVKSHVFESMPIDRTILPGKTIVSFMAGVSLERMAQQLGENATLVRAMPSIAIENCNGVIGYTSCSPELAELFGKLGYAFEVVPEDIEKVMAFSACGLGFAAYLIDAFAKAGETLGFSSEDAEKIAAQTFQNAVERGDFAATAKAVATPGGATEQGIMFLRDNDTFAVVAGAMRRAYEKMT
jgi:pyrroline-5-carboxylate reductase